MLTAQAFQLRLQNCKLKKGLLRVGDDSHDDVGVILEGEKNLQVVWEGPEHATFLWNGSGWNELKLRRHGKGGGRRRSAIRGCDFDGRVG